MVEINNQRKAFLDMLAWSWRTDNGRQKPEITYDVIVGGELFTITLITSQTCHKTQTQSIAPDATSFSFLLVGYRKQLGLSTLSEKSGRCGIGSRLRSVALTYD